MAIKLGQKVQDKITGFEGVVTGRAEFLTGCTQCVVVPPVDKKGAHREAVWFDEQRLVVISREIVVLDNGPTPGCDVRPPSRS